jgi:hypothetical protein
MLFFLIILFLLLFSERDVAEFFAIKFVSQSIAAAVETMDILPHECYFPFGLERVDSLLDLMLRSLDTIALAFHIFQFPREHVWEHVRHGIQLPNVLIPVERSDSLLQKNAFRVRGLLVMPARALSRASAPTTAPSFSVSVPPLLRLALALVLNGLALRMSQ